MSAEARAKGMALILSRMARLAQGRPVFLTGDFNAEPGSEPVLCARAALRDSAELSRQPHAGPAKTFNGFKLDVEPKIQIDYIFVSAGVRVWDHATVDDKVDGLYPSDHFPVTAQVSLE